MIITTAIGRNDAGQHTEALEVGVHLPERGPHQCADEYDVAAACSARKAQKLANLADMDPVMRETLNGRPFLSIEDADSRIGARLEVMAGGRYMWIPFAYVESVRMEPPRMLRDVRWAPAHVTTNATMREMELGEVLLPALSPRAWRLDDSELKLGRAADWEELADGSFAPTGQKLLRVDDELVPLLEVRDLVIATGGSEEPPA